MAQAALQPDASRILLLDPDPKLPSLFLKVRSRRKAGQAAAPAHQFARPLISTAIASECALWIAGKLVLPPTGLTGMNILLPGYLNKRLSAIKLGYNR